MKKVNPNRGFSKTEKVQAKQFFKTCLELMLSHDAVNIEFEHKINNLTFKASCEEDDGDETE